MRLTENQNSEDPILTEIVRRLVPGFIPDKIFLFGSRAMGTAVQDSDYDILVVVPELSSPAHILAVKAHRLLDTLDISKGGFANQCPNRNPLAVRYLSSLKGD